MKATITKTGTYNAEAIRALVAHLDNLPLAVRWERREAIKAEAQRAWKRGGKVGANPVVFF